MKDELKILTRKAKGRSHTETALLIDWDGMDQEKMMVLARSCIINALQTRWKRDPQAIIPDQMSIRAVDFVHG